MIGDERLKLAFDGSKISGLNLDEQVIPHHVDHETIDRKLELPSRLSIERLDSRVKLPLIGYREGRGRPNCGSDLGRPSEHLIHNLAP